MENTLNVGEIVIYQPNERLKLDVRVENETVWLTQVQMAELFASTKQNISLHISNIYKEVELDNLSTVKEYLTVQKEGDRTIKRNVKYYNLDVIISVGYRVKSINGTYLIGASLKDLGKKWLGFSLLQSVSVEELIDKLT